VDLNRPPKSVINEKATDENDGKDQDKIGIFTCLDFIFPAPIGFFQNRHNYPC
jgi:hypothetical protein